MADDGWPDGRPRLERWGWLLLVLLVIAVFARTIGFGLFNDDYFLARSWTTRDVLRTFHDQFDQLGYEQKYFRPLSSLSFATEWNVWGTNRWGYRLTNIAIHCGAVVALWSVLRRIRVAWWAALVGAAYFAVVPSNVAAVVYIAERTDAMVALCILAILLCLLRFRESNSARWLAWGSGFFVLGLLAKEVATATLPFVAVFWLYLRVERNEPASTAPGFAGLRTHWANEVRVIGRSIADRSARWIAVLAPFAVITVVYLAYRSAVLSGELGDRFSEGDNPIRALLDGVNSTLKGVPWEIRALPYVPVVAAFVLGFAARPRHRRWRVVLLGIGGMFSGVLPLTYSGSVEPRLLYVAEIGLAIAIAGLATVFGEAFAGTGKNAALLRIAISGVTVATAAAVAVSHVESQNLYKPGSDVSLARDAELWTDARTGVIEPANRREIERHLRDAGLLDSAGNLIEASSDG